jgi:hypothetical protein
MPELPTAAPFSISGVVPQVNVAASLTPVRTESGIGALMAWANRLWFVSYVAHKAGSGEGTGLFELDERFVVRKRPESVVGTYANRLIHAPSNQCIIGPHIIDTQGNVRTIAGVQEHRLAATMEHLTDPLHKVYFLTMEGHLFEVDVHSLETTLLFDLNRELGLPHGCQPHFKGGHAANGRVVVANNTYDEPDFEGSYTGGVLAEWDGMTWRALERKPFMDVWGRKSLGNNMFAVGWDRASAILKVFSHGGWSTYRLPKASHTFEHFWQTEWTRVREVEHERLLIDCFGMFYEASPVAYSGKVWGVRPISTHLRVIPDFCTWRGLLVLGGNQVSPGTELHWWKLDADLDVAAVEKEQGRVYGIDNNNLAGETQSNLWFGKLDDLWGFGKPKGWGGPWWETPVQAGQPSDPYLMTGFEHKVLHLYHDAAEPVTFTVEVDVLGNGAWKPYAGLTVPAGGYLHHEFPSGFSVHWVRLIADRDCRATGYLYYT